LRMAGSAEARETGGKQTRMGIKFVFLAVVDVCGWL
jgi:hypothetical protein